MKNDIARRLKCNQMLLPELRSVDLLAASTGQFQSIGTIILIVASIGTFSRERQNGTVT